MATAAKKKKAGGGQLIKGAKRKTNFEVDVSELSIFPEWHKRFDERSKYAPDPAMIANIAAIGIRAAIKVEVVKSALELEGKDGKTHTLPAGIYIVNGHQRYGWGMAAKKLLRDRGEDDTVIAELDPENRGKGAVDEDYLATLSIALNRHVEDDAIVTARKLKALMLRCGNDIAVTAVKAGRTKAFVKQHLDLLVLSPKVLEHVRKGELSVTAASKLAALATPAEQIEAAEKALADGKGTVREVTKAVRGKQGKSTARPVLGHKAAGKVLAAFDALSNDPEVVAAFAAELKVPQGPLTPRAVADLFLAGVAFATGHTDEKKTEKITQAFETLREMAKPAAPAAP